jgi:DNA-binding XRE family transcriptional regulator
MTKAKLAKLPTHEQVLAKDLRNPEFRAEWDRTEFAHAVALRVIAYRVEHKLSQTRLGERLGMKQPAVARLEAGEHEPSLTTLARLARVLGIEFHIDITSDRFAVTA